MDRLSPDRTRYATVQEVAAATAMDDTGWIDHPNTVAAGNLKYRRRAGWVVVSFNATAQTASGTTYTVSSAALPVGFRPDTRNARGVAGFDAALGAIVVDTGGNVLISHSSGGLRGAIDGWVTYPVSG